MKNYFNNEERTRHLVALAMQETIREFKGSDSLSDEERNLLETALSCIEKFNGLIFERMGEPYRRKIEKTMMCNKFELIGKYAPAQACVNHATSEDLARGIKELRMFNCMDCEKCDYLNCGTYACMIACDIEGEKKENNECPFRM